MPAGGRRTLIVTLPPRWLGGVQSKARFLAGHLRRSGHRVTVACYAGRSERPDLNRGLAEAAFGRRGLVDTFVGEDGCDHAVIGCQIPELEYTYTAASDGWRSVINAFDRIVAVGGTPLIAHPVVAAGKRALVWCADDLDGDRTSRRLKMPWLRRHIDSLWIAPRLEKQQAAVLGSSCVIAGVSAYSVQRLRARRAGEGVRLSRLPIPVEVDFFSPPAGRALTGRMGFAGRVADPRKNAELLFAAFRKLRDLGAVQSLDIAGPPDDRIMAKIKTMERGGDIRFLGVLDRDGLREFYRSLDVLAMTSHREGLGIAGLEAMACGTPVVSTRSGGPEDFVIGGVTGYLSGFSVDEFADRVRRTVETASKHAEYSENCRRKACEEFSEQAFARDFGKMWRDLWNEDYRTEG